MNEPWQEKGSSGVEEFRHIQSLAREGRMEEAQERALVLLETPRLSRKLEAKVHNLICRLYVEGYARPGTSAALHGEEAVRLADALHDPWLRCEALTQLIRTYCRLGDFDRARGACDDIQTEADRNPGVVAGGPAAAWALRMEVYLAMGDMEAASSALRQAEALSRQVVGGSRILPEVRLLEAELLLLGNHRDRARRILAEELDDDDLRTEMHRAWLAALELPRNRAAPAVEAVLARAHEEGDQGAIAQALALRAQVEADREEAAGFARLALNRAIDAGRADLARRLRSQLAKLLE